MADVGLMVKDLENQNCLLRRQLRDTETVSKKDKAIFEQKIELLEFQVKESQERLT